MAERVSTDEVVAFRLRAHHLLDRLDEGGLLDAVASCAVQNSPPGSALLALHARARGVTTELLHHAVGVEKLLMQTWCMRGAPFHVPTADAYAFTTGVLPPTEETMRHLVPGAVSAVDRLGITLTAAVDLTGVEIGPVLSGRRLDINELGAELAERIAPRLSRSQRDIWQEEGAYAAGQPLGQAVVHFCLRILALRGVVCLAPRAGNRAPFVLVDEWLGHPIPDIDPDVARVELLRRYLHCYGPSGRADFAAWLGIRAADTDPWWNLVTDELTPVEFRGTSWMLTEDLPILRSGQMPTGVRLLPPHDPYTQLRDRDTIVDKTYQPLVWKSAGDPGSILVDGRIIGIWRPRKSDRRLTITVTTLVRLPGRTRSMLQEEAEQLAPLRGASSVDVEFSTLTSPIGASLAREESPDARPRWTPS